MRLAATCLLLALAAPRGALAEASYGRLGVMADVGAPDGATASLVIRPAGALRIHAGVSHNLVSQGLRAGVTLVPLATWFTPTLAFDYGRYPEGNANPLVQRLTGDPTSTSAVLERVGYDYANIHLGFEMGRRTATFYLHVGASRVTGDIHNLDAEVSDGGMATVTVGPAHVTMWSASARLGLVIYLL